MTPPPGASRLGTRFGPYELKSLIGVGGMGEVYRAYDIVRDRTVALKVLSPHLSGDDLFQRRFRRECQTIARLSDPHIVPIHDFGEIDGRLYLNMRLIEGRDLGEILAERRSLPPAEAVRLVEQVADALESAHRAGLTHRDVKPENILVTDEGFAYLIDFGASRAEDDPNLTQDSQALGSVAYMAPEQFGDDPATSAVDVHA